MMTMTMMTSNQITNRLICLTKLDIDMWHAYGQALDLIANPRILQQIKEIRNDHEQHIKDLSALVRMLGEVPPEFKQDFQGFLIYGITSLSTVVGQKGALEAMRINELYSRRIYSEALQGDMPGDVKALLDRIHKDEVRHLKLIQEAQK